MHVHDYSVSLPRETNKQKAKIVKAECAHLCMFICFLSEVVISQFCVWFVGFHSLEIVTKSKGGSRGLVVEFFCATVTKFLTEAVADPYNKQ